MVISDRQMGHPQLAAKSGALSCRLAFLLGNGQTYATSVPYYRVSRIFMSRIFHPCNMVPHFHVPQFHVSHFQRPPLIVQSYSPRSANLHSYLIMVPGAYKSPPLKRHLERTVHPAIRFYRAMLCIRGTSHGPVSVRLSQVGVLLKRLNRGSHKQYHTIAQGL